MTRDGSWMRPSAQSAAFSRLARSLGLPAGTTMHTLRHTHATMLLYSGVPVETIRQRLGHADVATTLRLYAHALEGADRAAAEPGRACGSAPAGVPRVSHAGVAAMGGRRRWRRESGAARQRTPNSLRRVGHRGRRA